MTGLVGSSGFVSSYMLKVTDCIQTSLKPNLRLFCEAQREPFTSPVSNKSCFMTMDSLNGSPAQCSWYYERHCGDNWIGFKKNKKKLPVLLEKSVVIK